jgi:ATPase subunit of ABC transporter with duplicated ATPase domains
VLRGLGFSQGDLERPAETFSGGWQMRIALAKLLLARPNLLLLDEPTNHLDLATKEMLLKALHDFEGTMLFVSHDRRFLASLSNRVLELDGGHVTTYGGGYLEYVARSGHEAPGLRPRS